MPLPDTPLLSREARKQHTRGALLDAARTLMAREGRGFTGLGLREITREAGVVPTSFYRHFRDMDELGLALVEESGITLRRLLREARKAGVPDADMIRRSVRIYLDYVQQNQSHILFICNERHGGSPLIRAAIRTEVGHFANEMAQDLRLLNVLPQLSSNTLEMICALVVNTMLSAATDILDLPPGQPRLLTERVEDFVRQLRLIFLGAAMWKEPGRG